MTENGIPSDGIQRLVLNKKGSRSFARLSKDCGGRPSGPALQKMTSSPLKLFPDPDTIRGLSRGLNVSIRTVVEACGRSIGLDLTSDHAEDLLIVGGGRLPASSQEMLLAMAREMLYLHEATESGSDETAEQQEHYGLAAFKGQAGIGPYDLPEH